MVGTPLLSREHLETVVRILDSKSNRLDDLCREAGLDPTTDLRGSNLKDCDFMDVDVAGWDLSEACLNNANLSGVINIDKAYFTKTDFEGARLPPKTDVEMLLQQRNPLRPSDY